ARPAGVGNVLVGTGVFVLPDLLARGGVEADDALLAGDADALFRRDRLAVAAGVAEAVHDVDAVANDGGAAVAVAQRSAPEDLGTVLGELLDQAGLAPDAVAPRAEPLRPVVGVQEGGHEQASRERQEQVGHGASPGGG